MDRWHRFQCFFWVALLALSSCTDSGAGRFQLQFEWDSDAPTFSGDVYLFGRIEEPGLDDGPAKLLGRAGPVPSHFPQIRAPT